MRNILLVFALLITQTCLYAQSAAQWQQIYGGPGVEVGYGVKSCLDQGYIVVGSTSSFGPADGYIVRTDSLGLVMWSKTYGGTNVDIIRAVEVLPDSGFIMTGYTNSFGNGGYDGWILRLDKNGDTLWTSTLGTVDWDFFYDVETTWDNGFVFAGGTYGAGMGDEDMLFVKMNSAGTILWQRTYGGARQDEATGVIETTDSMFAACGFTHSMGDTLGDSWILRINSVTGDTAWSRTLNYPAVSDKALGIARNTPYTTYLVVGETNINGDPDAYIQGMQIDSSLLFNFVFGGVGSNDYFSSVVSHPNGEFATLGYSSNPLGGGNGDYYFFSNRNGWFNTLYGTFEPETCNSIDLAHDDGYIACGSTEGFGCYQSNMHLLKIDTNGITTTVVSIQEHGSTVVTGITSVFPNPAYNQALVTLSSYTAIEGQLSLHIFDCTGREIVIKEETWQSISDNEATCVLSTTELNNGIYQYTVEDASGLKCSGKLVVSH